MIGKGRDVASPTAWKKAKEGKKEEGDRQLRLARSVQFIHSFISLSMDGWMCNLQLAVSMCTLLFTRSPIQFNFAHVETRTHVGLGPWGKHYSRSSSLVPGQRVVEGTHKWTNTILIDACEENKQNGYHSCRSPKLFLYLCCKKVSSTHNAEDLSKKNGCLISSNGKIPSFTHV